MFYAAVAAVLIALVLAVFRAVVGPTAFDRMLAANSIGSLAVLLLAGLGFLNGRPEWLDIALLYGLLNAVATLTILKYFRHGNLSHAARDGDA